MIRSLITGAALSDILLFIVNSMSWILRVSNDESPSTNDITKNQSERLRNIEPSLLRSSTIFKMAAAGEVECVDERMNPDINELLSEAVRRYPFLYDKTLKEFKDRKMKSNAWKRFFLTQSVSCFADFFFAFLLEKTTQWRTSRGASPPFCFLLLDVQ